MVCTPDLFVSRDLLTLSCKSLRPHRSVTSVGGFSEGCLCLFQAAGSVFAILGRHCVISDFVLSSDYWGVESCVFKLEPPFDCGCFVSLHAKVDLCALVSRPYREE